MERLKSNGIEVVIYEPTLIEKKFLDYRIIQDLEEFKYLSDLIVANRASNVLSDVKEKVYTRDIFNRD